VDVKFILPALLEATDPGFRPIKYDAMGSTSHHMLVLQDGAIVRLQVARQGGQAERRVRPLARIQPKGCRASPPARTPEGCSQGRSFCGRRASRPPTGSSEHHDGVTGVGRSIVTGPGG
jgi:hypothetical protein